MKGGYYFYRTKIDNMNRRTYTFDYNLPAENHISGRPDVFIPASAEWNKGAYYPQGGRPIIISEGPVIEKLNKHLLTVVKDWQKVYLEIERIAQDYFLDQYHVEQKVKVIIHDEISYYSRRNKLLMNREIKFRAWDKKNNCCLTDKDNVYLSEEGEAFLLVRGAASDYLSRVDVDVVFWTGLLDKNGKDIYEGDIVVFPNNDMVHIVSYYNASFVLKTIDNQIIVYNMRGGIIEIIGNIYENPNLLQ